MKLETVSSFEVNDIGINLDGKQFASNEPIVNYVAVSAYVPVEVKVFIIGDMISLSIIMFFTILWFLDVIVKRKENKKSKMWIGIIVGIVLLAIIYLVTRIYNMVQ